jgi:hypothetical protein
MRISISDKTKLLIAYTLFLAVIVLCNLSCKTAKSTEVHRWKLVYNEGTVGIYQCEDCKFYTTIDYTDFFVK